MKKEWELIKNIYGCTTILMQEEEAKETKNAFEVIEKFLKALEIIKPYLRLVDNCLQVRAPFVDSDDLWVFVKEITDEEELNILKEVLE